MKKEKMKKERVKKEEETKKEEAKRKENNVKGDCKNCKNRRIERYLSGLKGEELALQEMQKKNFSLVKKRFKSEYGEIDLIVEDATNKLIVFVEVKRRKAIYDYENVITKRQWSRIYNSANEFLSQNYDKYKDYCIRYDAFICFTNSANTIHIENIFSTENEQSINNL